VIRDPESKIVLELAKRLGRETNNVAEYYALVAALDYATTNGIRALRIRSDSELLVRQVQGRYKVKSSDLKPLHERATKLSRQLTYFAIEHVRRELNRDADALANMALDSGPVSQAGPKPKSHETVSPATRGVRARFIRGTFLPTETIDLPEGSEVVLDVKIATTKEE
jgi:ribonuclease HI